MNDGADNYPGVAHRVAPERLNVQKNSWRIAAMILSIKALLFLYAGQSYQVLADQRLAGLHGWLEIWNRWDSVHYQQLAQYGYSATGAMRPNMVFYPLFPWTIRVLGLLVHDYLISALIISALASIAAGILLQRLAQLDYSKVLAQRAVFFLFIFPTSYFLHIGYSESLFLMLALACILAARTQVWMLAGLFGALSCLTRATGLILIPALVVEVAQQYWTTRRWQWQWLWIGVVGCGFGVYLLLNRYVAGDAFAFLAIRQETFRISLAAPWTGLLDVVGAMNRTPAQAEIVGMQEFLFIVLGFVCTVISWAKLRPIYSVWMTGNWLLFTSASFVASVPRYTLTMFPTYLLFAMLAARRLWLVVITVWSLLYLAFFATLFVWGRWAF